jgi:hypothetical protein
MTSPSISFPHHASWPRTVALAIVALAVALVVSVALVANGGGRHSTARPVRLPNAHQSIPAPRDCFVRPSLHSPC